jgi:hypothetical protein
MPAREPALALVNFLIETLDTPDADRNVAALRTMMLSVHDALLPVVAPHMKESNYSRLTALFTFFSSNVSDVVLLPAVNETCVAVLGSVPGGGELFT